MRYRAHYSYYFATRLPDEVEIPLSFELAGSTFEITDIDDARETAAGFVEKSTEPKTMTLSKPRETINGATIPPRLIVPEAEELELVASTMVDLLSFVSDCPVRRASVMQKDELIPESSEDEDLLTLLGTTEIHHKTSVSAIARTFVPSDLNGESLRILVRRISGLSLYAQALRAGHGTAMFRELWRVLESAFGVQNNELVECLASYDPAVKLGISKAELSDLLILRGRASHAVSKAGMVELVYVNREIASKLARLKCLVEQVILTKRNWGAKSLVTERLAKMSSYVKADGTVVLIRPP